MPGGHKREAGLWAPSLHNECSSPREWIHASKFWKEVNQRWPCPGTQLHYRTLALGPPSAWRGVSPALHGLYLLYFIHCSPWTVFLWLLSKAIPLCLASPHSIFIFFCWASAITWQANACVSFIYFQSVCPNSRQDPASGVYIGLIQFYPLLG